MTTTIEQVRIYELDHSQTVAVCPVTAVLVPANCRTGSFSKPISQLHPTAELAVADAMARNVGGGDKLVRHFGDEWQVWQRRKVKGRVQTAGGGTRAHMGNLGAGQWYIEE